MAHLINSKSIRLGWTLGWCDDWFSKDLYYPYFLHLCFKIRVFLVYIFFDSSFHRYLIFWSHFTISKNFKNIFIKTFFYDGQKEVSSYSYEDKWELKMSANLFKVFFKYRVRWDDLDMAFFWILMRSLYFRFDKCKWMAFGFKFFLWTLVSGNLIGLRFYFRTICNAVDSGWFKNILVLSSLFLFWDDNIFEGDDVINSVYSYCYNNLRYISFFNGFNTMLMSVFSFFVKFSYNFVIQHLLITNDEINAKFLSRYLSKKLEQHVAPRRILNPLKREFRMLLKSSSLSVYYDTLFGDSFRYSNMKYSIRSVWRNILFWLFNSFFYYNIKYYNFYNLWFSLDTLAVYIWFNKNFNSFKDYVFFSRNFFCFKSAFLGLFYYNLFSIFLGIRKIFILPFRNFSFDYQFEISNLRFVKNYFVGFFDFIFYDLFVGKNSLISSSFQFNNFMKYFKWSNLNFGKVLNYNYWIFNYNSYWLKKNPINILNLVYLCLMILNVIMVLRFGVQVGFHVNKGLVIIVIRLVRFLWIVLILLLIMIVLWLFWKIV